MYSPGLRATDEDSEAQRNQVSCLGSQGVRPGDRAPESDPFGLHSVTASPAVTPTGPFRPLAFIGCFLSAWSAQKIPTHLCDWAHIWPWQADLPAVAPQCTHTPVSAHRTFSGHPSTCLHVSSPFSLSSVRVINVSLHICSCRASQMFDM